VDLRVRPANGGNPLPLRTINRLEEGDSVLYRPILRPTEKRPGEVAIVLVPARRVPDQPNLQVLIPKPAAQAQEWKVPSRSAVAAYVYGPAGLSRVKVEKFLAKDNDLIAQLADYAEKTAQTEALIQALSSDTGSGETVNAAFSGFASQYGFSTQIDRTAPTDQQMALMFRTLNPAMATYDPISPAPTQRVGQTASMATAVAALFFGSPVGLAAGGTAMLLQMHSLAFPNTVFRSSFAEPMPEDGLGLCGKRDAVPAHTKVAYLWATRIPNQGPPHLAIQTASGEKTPSLAPGLRMPIPIQPATDDDAKYIERAHHWVLTADGKSVSVPVLKAGDKTLDIDLSKIHIKPGKYSLSAQWDWDPFSVEGKIEIADLSDFRATRLTADSQDRLLAKSGRIPATLSGNDFEFVTKVEIEKPGDKFFPPTPIPFALPEGFRLGGQTRMNVQVNTVDLDAGAYRLLLTQADGKPHEVPIAILTAGPKIDNLPLAASLGDAPYTFTLRGQRLDEIVRLDAPQSQVNLGAASMDGAERNATLTLDSHVKAGDSVDLRAFVDNRSEPFVFRRAIEIMGPRPRITESRVSLPSGVDVALNAGELPSNYSVSALLHVADLGESKVLSLRCRDDVEPRERLRVGSRSEEGKLDQLAPDQLFITFDDTSFPNGCELLAGVESVAGPSAPGSYRLGRVVHIPKIDSMQVAVDTDGGPFEATLSGQDLETIDRAGWDPEHGTSVAELPAPITGEGQKQELLITLPEGPPSPDAPLYVWLRGESVGRASLARCAAPVKIKPSLTGKPESR
jgi:hypothetical protein